MSKVYGFEIEPWLTAATLIAEHGEDAANAASALCENFANRGRLDEARTMMSALCAVLALGPSLRLDRRVCETCH